MFRPGMHPLVTAENLLELQQIRPDFMRWYMACQPQLAGNTVLPSPLPQKLSFVNDSRPKMSSPLPKKRHSPEPGECQEQPLDLSAKRTRHPSERSREQSDLMEPLSLEMSDNEDLDEQDEPETVEMHFRRAGMILDLSRK